MTDNALMLAHKITVFYDFTICNLMVLRGEWGTGSRQNDKVT